MPESLSNKFRKAHILSQGIIEEILSKLNKYEEIKHLPNINLIAFRLFDMVNRRLKPMLK